MKRISIILILALGLLFFKSFLPRQVIFSNDGPLGSVVSRQCSVPSCFISVWQDLNWLGGKDMSLSIGPSGGFRTICFYWPLALCIVCLALSVSFILRHKISLRHLVGYSCFLFAGLIIILMIAGLDYEFAQAIMSVACLFFVFAIIFIID